MATWNTCIPCRCLTRGLGDAGVAQVPGPLLPRWELCPEFCIPALPGQLGEAEVHLPFHSQQQTISNRTRGTSVSHGLAMPEREGH